MNDDRPDCITEQHLILFGAIIQWFARHEVLMQQIMATVSGSDATSIKLLTSSLSFLEKRAALLDLLRHSAVPLDRIERIRAYLEVLHAIGPLRNDIAHSAWTQGKSEHVIKPAWLTHGPLTAVKPVHDVAGNSKDFVERDEDQVTYTLENLKDTVDNLEINYAGFQKYLAENGLLSPNPV